MKETIRIAQITGRGIKKRCRKDDFILIQTHGATDEEAIQKLIDKIAKEKEGYRTFTLKRVIEVFNGEIDRSHGYTSIIQVLYPHLFPKEHNYLTYDYNESTIGA